MKLSEFLAILIYILAVACSGAEPDVYKFLWTDKNFTASGSCFAVSKTQIITARHCCYDEGKRRNCWVIVSGVKYPCELVKESKDLDLAVCEVKGVTFEPVKIEEIKEGKEISLSGFPLGEYHVFPAKLGESYYNGTARNILIVRFDHGFSGAAVIQGGKVIGISIAGIPKDDDLDKTKGLFLPAHVMLYFLNK